MGHTTSKVVRSGTTVVIPDRQVVRRKWSAVVTLTHSLSLTPHSPPRVLSQNPHRSLPLKNPRSDSWRSLHNWLTNYKSMGMKVKKKEQQKRRRHTNSPHPLWTAREWRIFECWWLRVYVNLFLKPLRGTVIFKLISCDPIAPDLEERPSPSSSFISFFDLRFLYKVVYTFAHSICPY